PISTSSSSANNSSTNSVNSSKSPTCEDSPPGPKAPSLYSVVAQNHNAIMLYFTSAESPVDTYALEYGTKSGDYQFGVANMGIKSLDLMTLLLHSLSPSTSYYFRVGGGHGCATGAWSNEMSTATRNSTSANQLEIVDIKVAEAEHEGTDALLE